MRTGDVLGLRESLEQNAAALDATVWGAFLGWRWKGCSPFGYVGFGSLMRWESVLVRRCIQKAWVVYEVKCMYIGDLRRSSFGQYREGIILARSMLEGYIISCPSL